MVRNYHSLGRKAHYDAVAMIYNEPVSHKKNAATHCGNNILSERVRMLESMEEDRNTEKSILSYGDALIDNGIHIPTDAESRVIYLAHDGTAYADHPAPR